ncbi:MAG: anthranilate synthase component I [Gammaproteobacteria bacterium]|nr:anthranilate synthase component I [Gammaproteobacteria bacterium]PCH64670.1 MAG: anthranilate synthase component I [Gammaproteobacteria bacterium]
MQHEQFTHLASQGYNRIPVMREVCADLDTPLSVYLKLADGPLSYLFESVQGGEKWGRYSIIGLPCRNYVRVDDHDIQYIEDGKVVEHTTVEDPLAWLQSFQSKFRVPDLPYLPRFNGGLVGYFGYDTVRYVEPKLADKEHVDALGCPDILLMVSDEVVVFDNLAGKAYIVIYADLARDEALDIAWGKAQSRLTYLSERMAKPLSHLPLTTVPSIVSEEDFISGFSQHAFEAAVEKAKRYIVDGDVMQVVLSQRLSIDFDVEPIQLYRALRSLNPSPYMYFLNMDEFHIVGSSPEILARYENGDVTVRPIAGTRRRGKTNDEDVQLEQELLSDPKECAEHLMLIDLGRNDVGRVATTGSVKLTENMLIERYSHVMHIVSNVVGKLKPKLNAYDVLRATFPAGTVSGAPKVRAMEIIDELEPVKRGIYAGAVGYIGWNGNMDTAIAIRTAIIKDNTLHIQAGAGIVADSIASQEWQETMNKGRAIFRAVALAAAGLNSTESDAKHK